ncbi:U-box domain-containing protein 33-like [Ananas comosus]|uniref:RING-type E3 ubiquitin transferase n=1 Tax=Ananas comosus TaxID=4615 RepID=A0A6P5H360_ANACO|nr:U-box domain-containing protein 33-like [Ananas comosus]
MALLSCAVPVTLLQPEMERRFLCAGSERSVGSGRSSSSCGSGGGSVLREEAEEEEVSVRDGGGEEEEEEVYVAVGKEVKEGRANLMWVLRNISPSTKIVVVHVHRPAMKINILGAWFPVSQLQEQEVIAYRLIEKEKMNKNMEEFLDICASQKVKAEKIVIEENDIAKSIVELIAQHGIAKLVMGAAADKHYSRRMKSPKSKTAQTVQQQADPSCKILFVCKGNLICAREVGERSFRAESSTSSTSPWTSVSTRISEQFKSTSVEQGKCESSTMQEAFHARLRLANSTSSGEADQWNEESRRFQASNHQLISSEIEEHSNAGPSLINKDAGNKAGSTGLPSPYEYEEDLQASFPSDYSEDIEVDQESSEKLRDAFMELENLKREAHEESWQRQKAERDLVEASRKVKEAENLFMKEVRQNKEIEERLEREKGEFEEDKQQLSQIHDQLKKANEQRLALELQIRDSECMIEDFEGKLSEAYRTLGMLRDENRDRQRECNVRDVFQGEAEEPSSSSRDGVIANFAVFTYSELKQATNNFDESLKIGDGGRGSVYKGFLRSTTVAVKMLNSKGESEFNQEVEILSKVRHPNLAALVGACREARALVYEFVPDGNLEDRLRCARQSPPLAWQARMRIASEICAALIFLHSQKPKPIVHGNLKPENVLLDANHATKLADLLVVSSNTADGTVLPLRRGRGAAYVDPNYLATGTLTPQCDVYSFGVILLRLLTGRGAHRIAEAVREALDRGDQLIRAELGLRCCDLRRSRRPDLGKDVWRVLEPVMNVASLSARLSLSSLSSSRWSFRSDSDGNCSAPSYFLCPILQEIMKDPQIAADGFTYEGEAIRGWLQCRHDTSPVTNLKLTSSELIPNHALRSAIYEWLQKHR